MRVRVCSTGLVLTAVCLLACTVAADDSGRKILRTGRTLQRALESRRALSVQAIPIRDVLADLQTQTQICIVVDRRIDPSQRLTLNTDLIPTVDLLRHVASELQDAGLSVNRSFVYIGPAAAAWRLRTLCEQKRSMILELRNQFEKAIYGKVSKAASLEWNELVVPRDIFIGLADSVGLTIRQADLIPQDLWHANRWSAMPIAESGTLLLNQFDLTFQMDAAKAECSIVPIPNAVLMERRHRVNSRRRKWAEAQLTSNYSELTTHWDRSSVLIHATFEQHELIANLLSGRDEGADDTIMRQSLKTRLFTLSLPQGAKWRSLIDQLQKSGVTVRIEGDLGELLNQKASAEFRRLPGSQFFPQLFKGLPVQVEVRDEEVVLHVEETPTD